MEYEEIRINYKELSVLTDQPNNYCRQIFKNHLSTKKVGIDSELNLVDLEKYFKPIVSLDERYNKMPKLKFCKNTKALSYRAYLKDKALIKAGQFINGSTVFNKILSTDQLEHSRKALKHNHLHTYGQVSYDKLNIK